MEDTSLYPLKCGFCGHGNPAGSRYCNACGAPLTAQTCPQCGTTNDATATTCQECDAALADNGPDEFFLPLPPEVPTPARSAQVPVEAAAVTALAHPATAPATARSVGHRDVPPLPTTFHGERAAIGKAAAADHGPSEVTAATPVEQPTEPATDAGPEHARTAADDVPPAPAASPVAAAAPLHDGAAGTSRGRGLAWAAVLAALGIAVYFAYGHFQRFQPSDAARRPGASVATDRALPALASDPAKPVAGGAAPPDAGAPVGQTKVTVGDSAGGKGGQGTAPAAAGSAPPQPPTDIFMVKPEADPQRAARQVQETTKAAAPGTQGQVRRAAGSDNGGAAQRPPGAGTCTDALAAVGLCTQENTQGRKP